MRIAGWTVRLLATGGVAGLLVGSLSGCGSPAHQASADLMTPLQARAVAQAWIHADLATELAQERGSLQRIDQAGEVLRTPNPSETPDATVHDDTIWITHQSHYPITFVCFDRLAGGGQMGGGQLFRFSKASAAEPWTVTHQSILLAMGAIPPAALDAGGYAQLVPAKDDTKLVAAPLTLGADWATYLQANNSKDDHEFAGGVLTTGEIADLKKQVDADAAQHTTPTFTFAPTDDPVDAYLMHDGSAVVLVGLQITTHHVAQSGAITVKDDGKGITGPAPGKYHDITDVFLALAAFVDPVKGHGLKVSGIGVFYGAVSSTATRE